MLQVLFTVAVITGLLTGGIGGALAIVVLFICVAYGLDYINAQKDAQEKASEEAERLRAEAEYATYKDYCDMKRSQYRAELMESLRNESKAVRGEEQSLPPFQEVKGGF